MFDSIKKALGIKDTTDNIENDAGDEIKIDIAACVVLLEVAESDSECTEEEISHVLETMQSTFNLSREHAEEMIELARHVRKNSVDIWQFTNKINKSFDHSEKIMMLEAIWRVIYADGRIDKHEDYLVHQLANLLRLRHKELIDAKIRCKKDNSEQVE
jgi:uncharacterized tellurite resistance protein B-like protein